MYSPLGASDSPGQTTRLCFTSGYGGQPAQWAWNWTRIHTSFSKPQCLTLPLLQTQPGCGDFSIYVLKNLHEKNYTARLGKRSAMLLLTAVSEATHLLHWHHQHRGATPRAQEERVKRDARKSECFTGAIGGYVSGPTTLPRCSQRYRHCHTTWYNSLKLPVSPFSPQLHIGVRRLRSYKQGKWTLHTNLSTTGHHAWIFPATWQANSFQSALEIWARWVLGITNMSLPCSLHLLAVASVSISYSQE